MTGNNQKLRELFSLPPIPVSASTAITSPVIPKQEVVTGDMEVDAVLWLQSLVKIGNPALIDKALDLASRIQTPMKELGRRYAAHILRTTGNSLSAALSSFGFGELKTQAARAVERANRRHEALSRFGSLEALFADTPAEKLCRKALRGLKKTDFAQYDREQARVRFERLPEIMPATISDCLYARAYWKDLYLLRAAASDLAGDSLPQAYAHETYCLEMLGRIAPLSCAEALAAFNHLDEDGGTDWETAQPTIRHLIASGWSQLVKEVA